MHYLLQASQQFFQQRNISACAEVLAGLKFEKDLIRQFLREELMRESVIYQEILQVGRQQGRQEGRQEEGANLILRLLARRLGQLTPELNSQIQLLSVAQLEELGEALLDFSTRQDLIDWLQAH